MPSEFNGWPVAVIGLGFDDCVYNAEYIAYIKHTNFQNYSEKDGALAISKNRKLMNDIVERVKRFGTLPLVDVFLLPDSYREDYILDIRKSNQREIPGYSAFKTLGV